MIGGNRCTIIFSVVQRTDLHETCHFFFLVYTLCPVGLNCEETRAKRLLFHQVQKAWPSCIFGSHRGSTVNVVFLQSEFTEHSPKS